MRHVHANSIQCMTEVSMFIRLSALVNCLLVLNVPKKQTTKFTSANFLNVSSKLCHI